MQLAVVTPMFMVPMSPPAPPPPRDISAISAALSKQAARIKEVESRRGGKKSHTTSHWKCSAQEFE